MDSDYLNVSTPPKDASAGNTEQQPITAPPTNSVSKLPIIIGAVVIILIVGVVALTQLHGSTSALGGSNQTTTITQSASNPTTSSVSEQNSDINSSCPCLTKVQFASILNYSTGANYNYTPQSNGAQFFTSKIKPYGTPPPQQILSNVSIGYQVSYGSSQNITVGGYEYVFQSSNPKAVYNYLYTFFNQTGGQALRSSSSNGFSYAYYGTEIFGYKDGYVVYFEAYKNSKAWMNSFLSSTIAAEISSTI